MEDNHFEFVSSNENKIIQNEEALLPEVLTGDVFCKKDIEEKIISAIKPLTELKPCLNLLIHGPNGSGKTILVKHILAHLKDYNKRVLCVYVNCWYHNTSMAIYTKIADALGETVSRRGRATDEIFDRIIEIMKQSHTPILLVLDDLEGLTSKGDARILSNLAKIDYPGVLFGVIAVSEDKKIISKLHPTISFSPRFTSLEVRGYNKIQLLEILRIRADKGLIKESYADDLLERIAEIGEENGGNGRLALEVLWAAAKSAQQKGKMRIDLNDVDEINNQISSKEAVLTSEEKIIVNILKTGEKKSSELYWSFCKKLCRTKRQIRNYLKLMEEKGIIETREHDSGYTIKFKLIKLKSGGG
mgnify:FL=1